MAAKVLHTDCIHAADGSPLYLQLDDNFHDLRQRFLPNIGRFRALAGFAPEVVLTVTIDRGIYDLDTSWAKNRESDSRLKIVQKTDFTEVWRYVTGHLPDIGYLDPGSPMDFHAYCEVYLDGRWFTYDARFNVPRIGRVKVSCGPDAVDGAFATVYGPARLTHFEVWAFQVPPGEVRVGDPIDLSKRLDGSLEVKGLPDGAVSSV